MKRSLCKCDGISDPLELALCLAPPRGEYEVEFKVGSNTSIIVNSEGFFLRTLVTDETLPFMKTYERPIDPGSAVKKIGESAKVLCETVKMLKKAALHGSMTAARKVKSCSSLIDQLEATCGGEETL